MRHRFSAARGKTSRSRAVDMDSYAVICDRSGFRANASDCVEEWNGHFVIEEFAEERHPQEFIQVPREHPEVPVARPRDTSKTITQSDPPDWDAY